MIALKMKMEIEMLELTKDRFAEYVGDRFELLLNHPDLTDPVYLELVEVNEVGTRPGQTTLVQGQEMHHTLRADPFSLIFRSPPTVLLHQAMFSLKHEQLGDLPAIFLVPVSSDNAGYYYEALFN